MKKITIQAAEAFRNARRFRNGATAVNPRIGGAELLLHGHTIARDTGEGLQINLCGWNTPTTRERLNGLSGVRLITRKGQALLGGEPIPSEGWVNVRA